jgi:hypothetical protein
VTRRLTGRSREVGGADPIDTELGAAPAIRLLTRFRQMLRMRAALGLGPLAAPAVIFVPIGVLLGPLALNILSMPVLTHLDTVVSVALATLGVFVGLALDLRPRIDRRLFLAGSVEAVITIAVVAGAVVLLVQQWIMPLDTPTVVLALTLGICASASSAGTAELAHFPAHRAATRIADLDDVLPIVLGGLVIASVYETAVTRVLLLWGLTCLLGLGLGLAGWLLYERAHGAAERGVFVVGTLVLLGGSAAYLSLSPLLAGMVAGIFWTFSPGRADQIIRSDLQKIQHPLVVLLLLTIGASLQLTLAGLWLFAPFVVFRLAGKLTGGWVASRLVRGVMPSDLGAYLIPPGVLGLAFALNFGQVSPATAGAAVVLAATLGSLACELLTLLVHPAREPA